MLLSTGSASSSGTTSPSTRAPGPRDAAGSGSGFANLSLAGWWNALVSVPLFQFLLLRWYFRLFIWARFLWQVSRFDLKLLPAHPDGVGGLGFLTTIVNAFAPLLLAHGVLLAGMIADRIFFAGATLPQFSVEIIATVSALVFVVLGPLMVFAGQLGRARRTGLGEYGVLAQRYVREFDTKWVRGGRDPHEPLMGSADIQSLADLANSVRRDPHHAGRAVHEGDGLSVGGRHARPAAATSADDDLARRAGETPAGCRVLSKPRLGEDE